MQFQRGCRFRAKTPAASRLLPTAASREDRVLKGRVEARRRPLPGDLVVPQLLALVRDAAESRRDGYGTREVGGSRLLAGYRLLSMSEA